MAAQNLKFGGNPGSTSLYLCFIARLSPFLELILAN